jgi:hypothetical protein
LSTEASAKIKEELKLPFAESDSGWTYILLCDTSTLAPVNVKLRIPSNNEPVVIQFGSNQFAVHMNGETLRKAKAGYKVLGS